MKNKEDFLLDFIDQQRLNIFAITETWFSGTDIDNYSISMFVPDSHIFVHKPRLNKRGGGIGVVFHKSISFKNNSSEFEFVSFECMVLSLDLSSKSIRLIVIYRPPCSCLNLFFEEFNYLLNQINLFNDLIIMGDFNMSSKMNELSNLFDLYDLKNHISQQTHKSGNCLDLLIGSVNLDISNIDILNEINVSDHYPITFNLEISIKNQIKRSRIIQYRNLKNFNTTEFLNSLERLWYDANNCLPENLTDSVNLFNQSLQSSTDKFAPLRTKVIIDDYQLKPWFNREIIQLRRIRRKKERVWRRLDTDLSRLEYKVANCNLIKKLKSNKISYYRNLFSINKNDSRKIFNVFKNLFTVKGSNIINNSNCNKIVNEFSDFFRNKINKIKKEISKKHTFAEPNISSKPNISFKLNEIDINSLTLQLGSMNIMTSFFDPIPSKLLKDKAILKIITPLLLNIINLSITSGMFPPTEKIALIRPILKDDKLDPLVYSNYRPISNLTFLSKTIEKTVAIQLTSFLESNHVLSIYQSGYRSKHSTETATLKINNDILYSISKGNCVLLIMLDLSAAFDTVDHMLLLKVLDSIGFDDLTLQWFKSYLTDRYEIVMIDSFLSEKNT